MLWLRDTNDDDEDDDNDTADDFLLSCVYIYVCVFVYVCSFSRGQICVLRVVLVVLSVCSPLVHEHLGTNWGTLLVLK